MIKAILPYLYTGAIIAGTGSVGYLIAEKNGFFETEQAALVQPLKNAPAKSTVETPQVEAEPTSEIDAEAETIKTPSFTTLRVERDGSTVIAGSAAENSQIEIFDGEEVIAKTTAASNGDFVVVLEVPLKPGSHALTIRAITNDDKEVFSTEAGLINIPQPEKNDEVTVLVSEADKPTRILQAPKAEETALETSTDIVSETASASVSIAKADVETLEPKLKTLESEPVKELEVATLQEAEPVAVNEIETASDVKPADPAKPEIPVLIEAADVEDNKIFIAGKGEAGRSVNLYLNSKFLGTARITKNNAFLFEGGERLKAGRYDLRADMINSETGEVIARAEVSLLHEPEPVAEPNTVAEVETDQKVQSKPEKEENSVSTEVVTENEPEIEVDTVEVSDEIQEADAQVETAIVEQSDIQKAEIKTGTAVIIRRGDSLWRVASRNYGEGIRYTTIFEANRDQVRNPDLIFPGQVLKVPENEAAQSSEDAG